MAAADAALEEAKRSNQDRVQVAQDGMGQPQSDFGGDPPPVDLAAR